LAFEGKINFFFDPTCPWTFVASQWIRQVSNEINRSIVYRPFSLAIKNKENNVPEPYRSNQLKGLPILRMVVKMQMLGQGDSPLIGELYRQFAKSYHLEDNKNGTDSVAIAREVGFSTEVISAWEDLSLDPKIEDEMSYALSFTGNDVGVPIIVIDEREGTFGFFGPILHRLPDADHSVRMFNALLDLSRIECFSELKRSRSSVDVGTELI
jgi:2-hydroxychromene-2-carboxylate isomerase